MSIIKIGIVGYGNLGKGVEKAIFQNPDMELTAVFTRRTPENINCSASVFSIDKLADFKDKIDVMILCGGSAKDLPVQTAEIARMFHTVDSFDNHSHIPEYFQRVDEQAKKHQKLSLISTGWDPGLFSLMRVLGESVLPQGKTYTFWGKGLSQGHSDAVRRIPGVKMAAQYTIPNENALQKVRNGEQPEFKVPEMHNRVCYVVTENDADKTQIKNDIVTMPDYFKPYHTEVHFISEQEFLANHREMPHGGRVLRSGESGGGKKQIFEFSLNLESNPEFTSSVLVAYARAVHRLSQKGEIGAVSVFDIPLGYLSQRSDEDLRKFLL